MTHQDLLIIKSILATNKIIFNKNNAGFYIQDQTLWIYPTSGPDQQSAIRLALRQISLKLPNIGTAVILGTDRKTVLKAFIGPKDVISARKAK